MDERDWLALGAATVGESGAQVMAPRIHPVWPNAVIAGPAFCVRCAPGDNLAIHQAVVQAPRGSVLVVDVGDVPERGYWGEVLATAAQVRGIAGLIIDGGVRDVGALAALAFPTFASVIALPGTVKVSPGSVGSVARVGGVDVTTGDLVVCDADGVAVVPQHSADDIYIRAKSRTATEADYLSALRTGATTIELLGLDSGPPG